MKTIYAGLSPTSVFQFTNNGVVVGLNAVSKVAVSFTSFSFDSVNNPELVEFDIPNNQVLIRFQNMAIDTGLYTVYYVLYSVDYPDGVLFGSQPVNFITAGQ